MITLAVPYIMLSTILINGEPFSIIPYSYGTPTIGSGHCYNIQYDALMNSIGKPQRGEVLGIDGGWGRLKNDI